eukprot:3081647-Amphidinium_carterae.1
MRRCKRSRTLESLDRSIRRSTMMRPHARACTSMCATLYVVLVVVNTSRPGNNGADAYALVRTHVHDTSRLFMHTQLGMWMQEHLQGGSQTVDGLNILTMAAAMFHIFTRGVEHGKHEAWGCEAVRI